MELNFWTCKHSESLPPTYPIFKNYLSRLFWVNDKGTQRGGLYTIKPLPHTMETKYDSEK